MLTSGLSICTHEMHNTDYTEFKKHSDYTPFKKDSIKNQSTLILLQFDEYHLLLDCYILAEHTQIGIIG